MCGGGKCEVIEAGNEDWVGGVGIQGEAGTGGEGWGGVGWGGNVLKVGVSLQNTESCVLSSYSGGSLTSPKNGAHISQQMGFPSRGRSMMTGFGSDEIWFAFGA